MADLSALVITGAQRSAEGLGQNIAQGAELALKAEQIQQQKQKLAQDQEAIKATRYDKLNTFLDTASKMPEGKAKQAYVNKFIPNAIRAFGLENEIDPVAVQMAQGEPVMGAYLKAELESGRMTLAQVTQAYSDPDMMAKLIPNATQYGAGLSSAFRSTVDANIEDLSKAGKFATEESNKTERSRIEAQQQMARQKDTQLSAGDVEVRKKIAADFAKFQSSGGLSSAEAKIKKLQKAYDDLNSGRVKTGSAVKAVAGALTGGMSTSIVDPKLKAVIDASRSSINLKGSLDSQFSAKEAEQQYSQRTIDPALPTKDNATRVKAMLEEAKQDLANATAAFEAQGFQVKRGKAAPTAPVNKNLKNDSITADPRITTAVGIVKGMAKDVAINGLKRKGFTDDEIAKVLKEAGIK